MFKEILFFELKYRLRRPATFIYFLILMLMAFFATVSDAVVIGDTAGNTWRNSPSMIANMLTILTAFGMLVTSAIMSTPVYRDFEHNSHTLFYSLPINKTSYLGGRFLGAFLITLFVFSGILMGVFIGTILGPAFGWIEASKVGPFRIMAYIKPFLLFVVPNVLFSGAIFFSLATLTRKILTTYVGNVIILVLYIGGINALENIDNRHIASLLDPFGIIPLSFITRYWTPSDINNLSIPFDHDLVLNRLLWLTIGALIFAFTYFRFRFSYALDAKKEKKLKRTDNLSLQPSLALPVVKQSYNSLVYIKQLFSIAWLNFKTVVKGIPFIAIVFAGIVLLFTSASNLNSLYGTSVYPVTYALVNITSGSFALFMIIIIVFYSGELVWEERKLNMSQIYDALPIPNWLPYTSKTLALIYVQVLLLFIIMLASIIIQLSKGYFNIEPSLYIQELFGLKLFDYILMCVLSVLVQTLVADKFVGHFIMVVYYIVNLTLAKLGFDHNLYKYSGNPPSPYSDMNGYGHFLTGVYWFNIYWGIFALILAVISNLFWVRGTEVSARLRMKLAMQRMRSPVKLTLALLLISFVASGAFIYYNTNVLNKYITEDDQEQMSASFEKKYKKFEKVSQPRIVDVKLNVNIYPAERHLTSDGIMVLKNKTASPISDIHLTINDKVKIKKLSFNYGSHIKMADSTNGYYIYSLSSPLSPGDSVNLLFDLEYVTKGFVNSGSFTSLVQNGTFINNNDFLPSIGYNSGFELQDKDKRKKYGLPAKPRMPSINDSSAKGNNYISSDADWIRFETTLSTSADQIGIAPGYLQKEWTSNNRRFYHYKMDVPILNFYAFQSARYQVKRDKWKDVNIEIYYHKAHDYNVNKMIDAIKKSLDYYTKNFSPYQHKQVRIVEFPRYATFAQSFPNTIPYSESIGFIANIADKDAIDYVFYVTAHEVAHQWWAHQVIGANMQGATVMSETMSQYSALMVMEKEYGKQKMQKFLKYELDDYLGGRRFEKEGELPLMLCENQQYVHYNKGSVVTYALKDFIGEEKLNSALAKYLKDYSYQEPPYTDSRDFVKYINEVTPDSLKYLIKDMFEDITLYSNHVTEAKVTPTKGKYIVEIDIESKKYKADSKGQETEVKFNDYIEIGAFSLNKDNEKNLGKPLYLKKHKITQGKHHITITLDENPYEVGIDPYNKLVDRDSDDNLKKL